MKRLLNYAIAFACLVFGLGVTTANERKDVRNDVLVQLGQFASFPDHRAGFGGNYFRADIAVYNLANPANLFADGISFPRNQRGVGSDAIDDTPIRAFANFVKIGGIQEKLHSQPPL